MVDKDLFDHYSIQLENQLKSVSRAGLGLHRAFIEAQIAGADGGFLASGYDLEHELTGSHGEGALEVFRDLDRCILTTELFIEEYGHLKHPVLVNVLENAQSTYQEMVKLRSIIETIPPDVFDEIKHTTRLVANPSECFIATAVYGDINAPEVEVLREFRDNVLRESGLGRMAIDFYYSGAGERVANFITDHVPGAIPVIKKGLDYLVEQYQPK